MTKKKLNFLIKKKMILCQPCNEGKKHKEKFPIQGVQRAIQLLGLIYLDIYSPMQLRTYYGSTNFIIFFDGLFRYYHVYLIK